MQPASYMRARMHAYNSWHPPCLQGLMTSLLCGRDLSNALQLNQSILVITDNALLRWACLA